MENIIVTKKVNCIGFGVLSPSKIKKLGVIEVVTPELYDTDGYPVQRGLMDTSMGVIDPGLKCKTCGGNLKTCQGHFGHIALSKPILHILYMSQIHDFLKSTCVDCGRVLMTQELQEKYDPLFEKLMKAHNLDAIRALQSSIIKKIKTVKSCPFCEAKQPKIEFIKPYSFTRDGERIWADEIRERFEKIPDSDLRSMGYDSDVIRPEWLVLNTLLIPPIILRPSITLETGERSEDDLTHKLSDIVRVNQRLLENINAGAPEIIVEDLWDLLQYHITTYFNNNLTQIPPARHRSKRPLKTLAQRISGKEGRFRSNLAGKRVNFCARSVISPDPMMDINEVGVPLEIAKELTIPERVTEWNSEWLKEFIKREEYPTANYVLTPDEKRKKITDETKEIILQELSPGWVVERQLINGDIIVFNRQPSLHRLSMMGHIVKVVPGKTLRIHPLVCTPYNADFDGDEMNLHLPQTEEARAEARNLLMIKNQIITPRYGLSITGHIRENVLALFYLTKDMKLTKEDATDLLIAAGRFEALPKPAYKEKGNEYWDGKQIFSMLLPNDFSYRTKGKILKNGSIVHGEVVIEKGELTQGIMDNKMIGAEGGEIIQRLCTLYGNDIASDFINQSNYVSLEILRKKVFTHSFYDIDISDSQRNKIQEFLDVSEKEVEKWIKKREQDKIIALPGKTKEETFETYVLRELSKVRNDVNSLIEAELKDDSTLNNSAMAGAGDKLLNLSLISGFAGQQTLRGHRIDFGFKRRTTSHFKRGELSPQARGFIRKSYSEGVEPINFFFNSIVGRDSLMDTAMRTPKSGYMQRRIINALQDVKVEYDGTVRDSGKNIVQFIYGGDNVDVSKSDGGEIRI